MARAAWNRTHGMCGTKIYGVWWTMLQRCTNPRSTSYQDYGARGIAVCERWQRFENFYADMGPPPHGTTLERDDNEKGYSPENCRWVTRLEQAQNKRNSRLLTANGKTQSMSAWAREMGCSPSAILARLNLGWSVERAVTEPPAARPNSKLTMRQARAIRAAYPDHTMQAIADRYGVSKKTILNILHGKIFKEE